MGEVASLRLFQFSLSKKTEKSLYTEIIGGFDLRATTSPYTAEKRAKLLPGHSRLDDQRVIFISICMIKLYLLNTNLHVKHYFKKLETLIFLSGFVRRHNMKL